MTIKHDQTTDSHTTKNPPKDSSQVPVHQVDKDVPRNETKPLPPETESEMPGNNSLQTLRDQQKQAQKGPQKKASR